MKLLGLMSGTSLDGIDVALLEVEEAGSAGFREPAPDGSGVSWRLLAFWTRPYTAPERQRIQDTLAGGGVREVALLHSVLAEWFAEAALALLRREGVAPKEIAAVGSHGQTVWHEPPDQEGRGTSLQIGCPATLAERTGIAVVSDFRARDLAAGGHGAPLVPWADRVFFTSPDCARAIQNLGGMANVTWLPAASDPTPVLAFDTGPGVALLNMAAEMATGGRLAFDGDGRLALRGCVVEPVLDRFLAHPFFHRAPPRSTGREVFGPGMVVEVAEAVAKERGEALLPGAGGEGWFDVVATLTALTARSIGDAYRRWILPKGVKEVFLMGGGARNPALVEAIRRELNPLPVRGGEALGMDPDAREAAAFALLAWAHLRGLPANLPEATGSLGPRVLGSFTPKRKDPEP